MSTNYLLLNYRIGDGMVIYFSKRENVIVKWIRICSICIAFLCIVFALQERVLYPVWLLPIVHALGLVLLGDKNAMYSAPGIITLNVVMFCRYELVPLAIYLARRVSSYAINTHYINQAILLMLMELICILLVLGVTGNKYRSPANRKQNSSIEQLFIPQNKSFVFVLVVIVLIAIVIQFPSLVGGIGLILTGTLDVTTEEVARSGLAEMVWRAGLAWAYVYIISKIKDRDPTGRRSWLLITVATLIYVLFTFLLNLVIGRWYSIVCFAAAVFLIGKTFPQVYRRVCLWAIIPVCIVMVVLSVYKNTGYLSVSNSSILGSVVELLDVSVLDIYFAGPGCVNNGLTLYDTGEGGLLSLVFDTVHNMPVVNHFIDDSQATVELYASLLGRGDMIIPLSIQSMIYFGAPFFGLLSGIAVLILRKMDEQYVQANNALAFVYSFIAVWIGLIFILNYTVCISWFYAYIIPMVLLFAFTTNGNGEETSVPAEK